MRFKRIYSNMKILRTSAAALLVFCAAFTFTVGKSGIAERGVSVLPAEYKGIITLWHIDGFEGGVGSRKQFLLSVSRGFEKTNSGVLVMATDHTAESAENAMAEGRFPDLISYGTGVNLSALKPLETEKASPTGVYNGETYAVPWCRGGYCLIENPYYTGKKGDGTLIVSQGEYTQPLVAYALSGRRTANAEIMSPMNAYVKFVSGKSRYMVGTQRDVNRLISRSMDFTSKPLNEYNDLYQYVSVTATDGIKARYAQAFVNYLLSDEVQSKLNVIGMFGCYSVTEYESPDMIALANAKSEYSVSAFSSKTFLAEMQIKGAAAAGGDEKEFLNIKNCLICLEKNF